MSRLSRTCYSLLRPEANSYNRYVFGNHAAMRTKNSFVLLLCVQSFHCVRYLKKTDFNSNPNLVLCLLLFPHPCSIFYILLLLFFTLVSFLPFLLSYTISLRIETVSLFWPPRFLYSAIRSSGVAKSASQVIHSSSPVLKHLFHIFLAPLAYVGFCFPELFILLCSILCLYIVLAAL